MGLRRSSMSIDTYRRFIVALPLFDLNDLRRSSHVNSIEDLSRSGIQQVFLELPWRELDKHFVGDSILIMCADTIHDKVSMI
jgi:hypothetical protein